MDDPTYMNLAQKVHVILHIAASIDFTERLDSAVHMNVLGSMRVLSFARHCLRAGTLASICHVSTCYVNSNQRNGTRVREVVYPLPCDVQGMCMQILDMGPDELAVETPRLLRRYGYPNTYTFTKSLAEHVLMDTGVCLPLAIVRPSIIGASLKVCS